MAPDTFMETRRLEKLYNDLIVFAEGEFDRGKFHSHHCTLDVALSVQDRLNELDALKWGENK